MARKRTQKSGRKPGRPPLEEGKHQSVGVRVCFAPDDVERIRQAAGGVPLSAWVRGAALEKLDSTRQ